MGKLEGRFSRDKAQFPPPELALPYLVMQKFPYRIEYASICEKLTLPFASNTCKNQPANHTSLANAFVSLTFSVRYPLCNVPIRALACLYSMFRLTCSKTSNTISFLTLRIKLLQLTNARLHAKPETCY